MQLEQGQQGGEGKERQDLIANEFNLGKQQNLQFVLISLTKLEGMQGAREADFPSHHSTLNLRSFVLHICQSAYLLVLGINAHCLLSCPGKPLCNIFTRSSKSISPRQLQLELIEATFARHLRLIV